MKRLASMLADHGENVLFLGGLLLMSVGLWMAWHPLGYIAFGGTICLPMLIHRMTKKASQ